MTEAPIVALTPRGRGHQFVFYGDCCSGVPGAPFERNFAQVNAALQRLDPMPEFIVFLGDHIMGRYVWDSHPLQEQWRYWLDREMAWLQPLDIPIYHTTSNHDIPDVASEQVWRDFFPAIPANGPPGQEGLSYWLRRDDLLLVVVNTNCLRRGGDGCVEHEWLDETLAAHADARYKLVAGHHPVWPVNSYDERPGWCIAEADAQPFWSVLTRRGVLAYLCSHIIAFDVQVHAGVVQVCSGGAGTNYGPGGFMGAGEYHHFVQAALDEDGFRLQAVDTDGCARERYQHPLP